MDKDKREEAAKRLEDTRAPSGVDPDEQLARVQEGRRATLTRARREPFPKGDLVKRLAVRPEDSK